MVVNTGLIQAPAGYRYSLDPFLLSGFVTCRKSDEVMADLGAGCGVLAILLARSAPRARVLAVEIQPAMESLLVSNLQQQGLAGRVAPLLGDVRDCRTWGEAQSCDVVVSNPPFRKPGTGRLAPDETRATARHEVAGGLEDFVGAAAYLLKNGGRFYVVYLAERLADLLVEMRARKIEPKRVRMVHSRPGDEARLVLVEGRRAGRPGLVIEPPLYVYEGDGYSAEVLACYPPDLGLAPESSSC